MASVETFESTLKDVVRAKRISASKMVTLTDIALKCMQNDTQLVSILYRTHKSLSTSCKVSSLYTFDALARAARHQVTKQGLTGDVNAEQGNCATFLLKMEGILDGLFNDMVSSGSESKDKTKKILDIWIKSNTFPADVLARLTKLLKGAAEKEPKAITSAAGDPHNNHPTPSTSATPPQASVLQGGATDPSSVQSTLLALLSQAANAVAGTNGQTTPNTAATPVLDANQLSLFQHLTQAAKLGSGVPTQPLPLPVSLVPSSSSNAVPVVSPVGGPSQRTPNRDDHNGSGRRESNHDRGGVRGSFRGGFRGGFRGRGRGGYDHYRDRPRDREGDPPPRGRRSRSRSPPNRYGGRRDVKPYSPPSRPSASQYPTRDSTFTTTNAAGPSRAPDTGKDEFGRDLRAASPSRPAADTQAAPAAPALVARHQSPPVPKPAPNAISTVDHTSGGSDAPQGAESLTDPAPAPAPGASAEGAPAEKGLEAFDVAAFDPSEAHSWEALGNAWAVTHGYLPTQAELMQFVMSGGFMGLAVASQFGTQQQQQQQQQQQASQWAGQKNNSWGASYQAQTGAAWRGGGIRGGGRGGHGYGNGRDAEYTERAYPVDSAYGGEYGIGAGWSGAGAGDEQSREPPNENASDLPVQGSPDSSGEGGAVGGVGGVGRMQRIGDKWVFVRHDASEVA
ncbi:hypothetical protein SCP_1602590 [Sparassis crispa]|uniref:CID domain-containing protein n=1 Tax=Sparassis crispa TaxID=139825 RepID=A0A401H581_9APHY|nr:hypothetical protein SCP_1602590 [Sparassis crispa]GBE89596.1 hypothetical protein SCP_1602590 [Sparassis crispa]